MNPRRKAATAVPLTAAEKLEQKLLHVIDMEKRAASRVRRAATLLHKWTRARRRVERAIGDTEVRRIVNRLSAKPAIVNSDMEN